LAQRGSFPLVPAWSPHKKVLKGNALLPSGKQGITHQATNFALLYVANVNRDDLIFRIARGAAEWDRF
jgi:hypothetical protein